MAADADRRTEIDGAGERGHAPNIGDRMQDGTVYAGISPDTGKAMYTTPEDAITLMAWKEAVRYAARFDGHGTSQGSFRLPTLDELHVIFENHARIGGFNSAMPWYWSATEYRAPSCAWAARISGGGAFWQTKDHRSAIRLVRS
jgi:hypothetical protein